MFDLIKRYEGLEKEEEHLKFSVRQDLNRYKESEIFEGYFCIVTLLCSAPKTLFILSLNLLLFSILKIDSHLFLFVIASFASFFSFIAFHFHDRDKWSNFVYKKLKVKKTKASLDFVKTHLGSVCYLYLVPFFYPCFLALGFMALVFFAIFYIVCFCFEYIYISKVYGKTSDEFKQIGSWFLPNKILSRYKTKRKKLNKIKKEKDITYEEIKNSVDIINYLKSTNNLSSSEMYIKVRIIEELNTKHSNEILELHLNKRHEIINN